MPDGHDEPRQLFTLEEANQRLPLVRAIVRDIVTLFQDLHDRRERLNELRNRSQHSEYRDEVEQMERDLEGDIETLESYVVELKELGVALKDPLLGLVDFRTLADGREAYLCWKLGEDEISWWHELDSGFSDRRPIVELEEPVPTPSSGGDDTGNAST
ncbi:MAG: hypothetical protein CMJ65_08420 [Planctomycetaceae bacterium]|jgi:hypothetical protein|nr:hypothetical protein [Planctomycetaceae bacterium]MDP7275072.1 DUF2203 domain-containing protein [Planctomycetaceae bacterium]